MLYFDFVYCVLLDGIMKILLCSFNCYHISINDTSLIAAHTGLKLNKNVKGWGNGEKI